jgi:DegV family protein with EDD domain
MQNIALVTDSGAYFPEFAPLRQLPLTILPNHISIGGDHFREGETISSEAALARLTDANSELTLQPPALEMYARTFSTLARTADGIVCVCPSRHLTLHHERAAQAAKSTGGTCPILVIDSQSISAGQALMLLAVTKLVTQCRTLDELDRRARAAAGHQYFILSIEQVASLPQRDVLSASDALMSAMLDVMPMLAVEGGRLVAVTKARKQADALERLIEFGQEFNSAAHVIVLHDHVSHDLGQRLRARLQDGRAEGQIATLVYNPSLATFVGLGALGIAIMEHHVE